ncbi:MAG: HAD hydrolase-like protein [Rickettsiales bacterium]|jgi:HAD superfamily hydrolase (TIGR01450 family)|nr:HAD hydrolase-like protein [Rickettsiales bacterium]
MYIEKPEDLERVLLGYDIVLSDIYGVLWDGKSEIEGAVATLSFLRTRGKRVVLISNISSRSDGLENGYFSGTGLRRGYSYDLMVTSGDLMLDTLGNGSRLFSTDRPLKKCYVLGKLKLENFARKAGYELVGSPEEADFVYVGFPQLSLEEVERLDASSRDSVFESDMYGERYFDVTDPEIFSERLARCRRRNLPMLSDSADLVAPQADRKTGKLNYVLRQGTLAKNYREIGGEVVEICKPSSTIYAYALRKLESLLGQGAVDLKKSKIIMVGDTLDTDILGANNATRDLALEIDTMLTLCGVSGKLLGRNPEALLDFCGAKKLSLDYMVNSLALS